MKFDLSNVVMSYVDKRIKLVLPERPSEELAELIGALPGDVYVGSSRGYHHEIRIAGHIEDDPPYLIYLGSLIAFLFNIRMSLIKRDEINTAYLLKRSKGMLSFLKTIGYSKKRGIIKIPNWIWKEKKFSINFIRGLFDTDGCMRFNKG